MTAKKSTKKPAGKKAAKKVIAKPAPKPKAASKPEKAKVVAPPKVKNGAAKPVVTQTDASKGSAVQLDKDTKLSVGMGMLNAESLTLSSGAQAPEPVIPQGAHVEEIMAIQQGNKQFGGEMNLRSESGKAVLSVDVPAHQRDVVLAESMIEGCALAAVRAWDAVKNPDDASFANSVRGHRDKLITHAEAIYKGGAPMDGDTALARFEREVLRIKRGQDKEKN